MTRPDVTTAPKRLHILDDGEIEALYGRPCLSGDERTNVFTLTQPEKDLLASFPHLPIQLYFLLQLGYFKAKQLFFTFTFDDVAEDVTYLLERYFPDAPRPELRMLNKRTILKQRHRILKLFGYRLCTPTDRQDLFLRAQQAARISSKPVYVLRELLHYLNSDSEEDHYLWHECSRLITNCIVFYNMTLLSELWARKEATQDMTRIAHISPVAWQHINFYGRYDFTTASEPINMEEIVEALAHHPILSMVDEGDA